MKSKKLVAEQPVSKLTESTGEEGNLLEFAVSEATYTSYREAENRMCPSTTRRRCANQYRRHDRKSHSYWSATAGYAPLLRLLLQHGADPNARDAYFKRPLLFESITSYKQPNESVEVLLEAGANPNTLYTDVDTMETSALLHAAANQRWRICTALLNKGLICTTNAPMGKHWAIFSKRSTNISRATATPHAPILNR
ncbi:MAG: ankyrin repeat domain-containing protein [Lewinellaceae bacterium]|nr:ankyrin repeat domain-containing protein [Lewinellaceae bacterium]